MRHLSATSALALALAACLLAATAAAASARSTPIAAAVPPPGVPAPQVSLARAPQVSLARIEEQAMCVTCKIPLNEASSPQADRERAFIRSLIEEGRNEAQIKDALVGQYGPAVLALPRAHGFDMAVYVVPAAVVLALLVLLAVLLPSWRRRTRAREGASGAGSQLSKSDAARLDADLARFD